MNFTYSRIPNYPNSINYNFVDQSTTLANANACQITPTISSFQLSHDFQIDHNFLVKTIYSLDCSEDFYQKNFYLINANYIHLQQPYFQITQQGFHYLIAVTQDIFVPERINLYLDIYKTMSKALHKTRTNRWEKLNKLISYYSAMDNRLSQAAKDMVILGKQEKPALVKRINHLIQEIQQDLFKPETD